ncbi:hypothetical protein IF1G_07118 [Cordyceps javanica]|uniref:Uncharacterized protein n=1 Tax=Cordyceps javanica TaxID=43265 RepID=A0A545UXP4_9HYPO|nr:hypothetical protein IF1G_07118 [Cordyceps javanica]
MGLVARVFAIGPFFLGRKEEEIWASYELDVEGGREREKKGTGGQLFMYMGSTCSLLLVISCNGS